MCGVSELPAIFLRRKKRGSIRYYEWKRRRAHVRERDSKRPRGTRLETVLPLMSSSCTDRLLQPPERWMKERL